MENQDPIQNNYGSFVWAVYSLINIKYPLRLPVRSSEFESKNTDIKKCFNQDIVTDKNSEDNFFLKRGLTPRSVRFQD